MLATKNGNFAISNLHFRKIYNQLPKEKFFFAPGLNSAPIQSAKAHAKEEIADTFLPKK